MSRPSPALLVAVIALVAALAGSAVALPGKNKVDKNDIKKGAITKKAIKKGAVTKKAIKKGAVTEVALGDASVTAAKIAPHEPVHIVGNPGEPAFGNGGDGDCIWENASASSTPITGLAPVSFYKDQLGNVNLQGVAVAEDGPGGDGSCDVVPTDVADGVVFTLPSAYAPANLIYLPSIAGIVVIVPAAGGTIGGIALPPGSVFADGNVILDGNEFEPLPAAVPPGRPVHLSLRELKLLGR